MDTENKSTDNQDLENAQSEATTSPAGESAFPDKAIEKISSLRTRAQTAELRAERAEGVAEGLKQVATKAAPPAISPLDAEITRQEAEGVAEEDMTISPTIYRKHELWREQVANQKTETAAKTAKADVLENSRTASKAKHADWMDVVTAGQVHLTKGEVIDLEEAGADFGEFAYEKCKAATERAKPKTDSSATENKPGKPEEDEKVPTQKEILDDLGGDPQAIAVSQM